MRALTIVSCAAAAGAVVLIGPLVGAKNQRPAAIAITAPAKAATAAPAGVKGAVLTPGPDDAAVTKSLVSILTVGHFLQEAPDDRIAGLFLDQYLDSLDPLHLYFIQSDLDEFAVWRTKLDDLSRAGDTSPAYKMQARLRERVDEQITAVNGWLKTEKFAFDTDETYQQDRSKAPRPKDMAEAKKLWLQRLRFEYLQEKLNGEKPDAIVKTLEKRYQRLAQLLKQQDNGDVLELYLNALTRAYDPHTEYFGKSAYENLNIQLRLSLAGIGAVLRSEDGYARIVSLTPGGPAAKEGTLKPGDKIISVAQGDAAPVDTVDMKLDKVVEMIRGPKGTRVVLTIIPADATDPSVRKKISLVRDEVNLEDQEAKGKLLEISGGGQTTRLGVIELPSFYADNGGGATRKSATGDTAKLIKKLQAEKVSGIILDLRGDGGGSLTEAIRLTGLFIPEGPVVQVGGPGGEVEVERDTDPAVQYAGPMLVLTNRQSASASEIVAGALQDYGRAVIVGDTATHGKGTVQSVIELGPLLKQRGINTKANPGGLKITIRKFYRPSGSSTQLKGVEPDIVLPSLTDVGRFNEASLPNPMPWDTLPASKYEKMNLVQPLVADLKRRSAERVIKDKDFAFLKEDLAQIQKLLNEGTVSLNEKTRLREKEEAKARAEARQKELKARPPSELKIYPITLKQADQPGLPAAEDPAKPDKEGKVPEPDVVLNEARRILQDLVAAGPERRN